MSANRRRILIVCAAGLVSGKEIVALNLARGLRARGWDPYFVVSSWCDPEFVQRLEAEKFAFQKLRLGFISATLRLRPMLMTLDQLRYWPQLLLGYRRLLKQLSPEVVLHTNWQHALMLLPFLRPDRDVFWSHEFAPVGWRQHWAFRKIGKHVERIVCVSKAVAGSLHASGVAEDKLSVVRNGVNLDGALPPLQSNKTLRLGLIGQVAPWKGHDTALEAVAIVTRKGLDVVLKIFGKGTDDYVRSLRTMASELGITDKVEWHGFVGEHRRLYEDIDVCLVPSRVVESFGMAALEAAFFGRPAICAARGGLVEIVQDNVTGILVEPDDPAALAGAIETFAHDQNRCRDMGEAARRRAHKDFSNANFVNGFIDVFDRLKSQQIETESQISHMPR